MKNKVVQKIFIVICTILVLLIVGFSPNLIKKLTGNVNSTSTDSSIAVNTGVVLNLNKVYDYSDNKPVTMRLYNGSKNTIVITSIIYRNVCIDNNDCDSFTVKSLDSQITILPDQEKEYVVSTQDFSALVEIGFQYDMITEEDDSIVTKTYNIASSTIEANDSSVGNMNGINNNTTEDDSKEFTFNSSKTDDGKDNVYIKLTDSNIHMDISEDLEDLNIYYSIKSGFGNKWVYEHPQTENSTTNKSMFGSSNTSNIKTYFTYAAPTSSISGSGSFEYNNQFKLTGTPNGLYYNEDVILGFYFKQYKDSGMVWDQYTYWSDESSPFSSKEIPHFTLTVYDKSALKTAILNGFSKIDKQDEEVDLNSWYEYVNIISNAIDLYNSRDKYNYYSNYVDVIKSQNSVSKEVTQEEINNMINLLNNTSINKKASADYAKLNELEEEIQSKQESWYIPESYAEFKIVYDERSNYDNLSSAYQTKIDNYVVKLRAAFDKLIMYDADYSAVDEAIEKANVIVNKTEDGKYDLYTQESWNRLQDAINAVDESLKIEDQIIVDGYATAILEAIETLEIAPANYDNLNKLIDDYENSDGYINNWYTIETANEVSNVINSIDYTKKITEQDIVDNWEIQLISTLANLKLKLALGYYDKDNYHPEGLPNSLSVEGYMNYFKSLNRNYYTDETLELIDELISAYDKGEAEEFKITIDNQSELDTYIEYLNNVKENMLIKKPGDYTQIEKYLEKINSLNRDYYVDFSQVDKAIENINYDYKIDEQDKIDEKAQEIKSALDGLVMKKADYTNFNAVYEKAKKLNENYYIDFSKVTEALEKAESSKNLYIDKQSVVDEITKELNDAIEKLVLKDADYSKIEDLKNNISHMDKTKYTNFNIVETALNSIVYGKKIDEQSSVDQMYLNLKKAYDSLEKIKADYKKLYEALANAKKYESNKTNYTNYDEVEKLINSIDYNLTWDRQDEVDELTKKINDAVSNLVKKLANYDELSEILSKIPKDYSGLDTNLQKEIKEFLQKAKSISNNLKYDEQYKIDELVEIGKKLLNKIPKNEISSEIVNESNEQTNTNQSSKKIVNYIIINKTKFEKLDETIKYIVEYDVSSVNISVGLASKDSKYVIYGGDVLTPGKNEVTIVVTTKEGKNYTYKLEITRKDTSNYLSDLKIENYDIEFNKTKQEYSLKIDKDVQKLDITAITEDENAKVSIKGNENLKDGSKITIEVKSTDNDIRIYTINIEKSSLSIVGIIIILVMFLSILAAIVKFINYKKNNAI